ncbi:MAG TPA: ABC transporter permease, partial [Chloroflexota bacterium]|nr:ABC transporter permease [Chloroflexota bacterium]
MTVIINRRRRLPVVNVHNPPSELQPPPTSAAARGVVAEDHLPHAQPFTISERAAARARTVAPARGFFATSFRRFAHDRLSVVALFGFLLIAVISAGAPWIADNVLHTNPDAFMRTPDGRIATLQPPGRGYLLGTDDLGRDNLTRLIFAGRVSLLIGFLVAFVSIFIGTTLGLIAGYYGGRVDDLVNAVVQFMFNIPTLFVLIILSVFFTPNVLTLALIFGLLGWAGTTRQVRGEVLSVRQ